MDTNKRDLIELHKIARQAQQHADTINMQFYLALGIVISLFLAGIGFIFSPDFPLRQGCVYNVLTKLGILFLFGFTEWVFYRSFRLRAEDFQKWSKVIGKTAEKLPNETTEGLLIEEDPNKTAEADKKRLGAYKIVFIVAFIGLGLFLFLFIQ